MQVRSCCGFGLGTHSGLGCAQGWSQLLGQQTWSSAKFSPWLASRAMKVTPTATTPASMRGENSRCPVQHALC